MILAVMLYTLAIGVAVTVLAWAAERLIARRGLPRRFIWLGAVFSSTVVPALLVLSLQDPHGVEARPASPVAEIDLTKNTSVLETPHVDPLDTFAPTLLWPNKPGLDEPLVWGWATLSIALLLWLIVASSAFSRRMRVWPVANLDGHFVRVSPDTGPAVCGVLVPRIVVPQWVVVADPNEREFILMHEVSHLRAKDPLLFRVALLVIILLPWNLPLWWQLNRLRFAIEVDCDARVLELSRSDARRYGEVLLTIGQRLSRLPANSVALNESGNQLERRIKIMMLGKPRSSAFATGALLLLAAGAFACAATLNAPQLTSEPSSTSAAAADLIPPPKMIELRWPQIDASLQKLLERKYNHLLSYAGNEVPLIEVLFASDGTIERSELRMLGSKEELSYSGVLFEAPTAQSEWLAYVQPRDIQPPAGRRVRFHFGEHKNPSDTYVYAASLGDLSVDIGAQNRSIISRFFPDVAMDRVDGGPNLWVLLDNSGNALASGREAADPKFHSSSGVTEVVMTRYPGIVTNAGRMMSISDSNGKPLQDSKGNQVILNYVWLDPASPMPGSWARN